MILLEPITEDKTRLIVRTRGYVNGPLAKVVNLFNEVGEIADGLTQINNIKQRAEVMTQLNPRLS